MGLLTGDYKTVNKKKALGKIKVETTDKKKRQVLRARVLTGFRTAWASAYNELKPSNKTGTPETRRKKQKESTPVDHRSQSDQTLDLFPTAIPLFRRTNPPQASQKVSHSDDRVDGNGSRPSNPSRLELSSLFLRQRAPKSQSLHASIRTVGTPDAADLKDAPPYPRQLPPWTQLPVRRSSLRSIDTTPSVLNQEITASMLLLRHSRATTTSTGKHHTSVDGEAQRLTPGPPSRGLRRR
ncbi:predicted protein [Arabidopsis lyrata subsp. lyrata]|uniref:Predicted protein n=1 Tax=Arabidopsis lyrata subsp. lyrata TaxID=81972 RepID=D7KEP9_ARALL|nr:predicted protein [Arabidopsis lyrata subsp. lyrata]